MTRNMYSPFSREAIRDFNAFARNAVLAGYEALGLPMPTYRRTSLAVALWAALYVWGTSPTGVAVRHVLKALAGILIGVLILVWAFWLTTPN